MYEAPYKCYVCIIIIISFCSSSMDEWCQSRERHSFQFTSWICIFIHLFIERVLACQSMLQPLLPGIILILDLSQRVIIPTVERCGFVIIPLQLNHKLTTRYRDSGTRLRSLFCFQFVLLDIYTTLNPRHDRPTV